MARKYSGVPGEGAQGLADQISSAARKRALTKQERI